MTRKGPWGWAAMTCGWQRLPPDKSETDYPTPAPHPLRKRGVSFLCLLLGADLGPDLHVHGFLEEDRPHNEGHGGDRHWIPQPGIDIAGEVTHPNSGQRHQ